MKSIKTKGLACIAMLALAAMLGVSSASASQFRGEAYPVTFKGEQNETGSELSFNLPGTSVGAYLACWPHTFAGSVTAASSSVSLAPSYGECEMSGVGATVKANGCHYVLHSTSESAPFKGSMDIACDKAGEAIEAISGSCKQTIPAQSGLGTVEFSNTGKGRARAIVATFNLAGLRYTNSGGCPAKMLGSFENGTLKGIATLKGANAAGTYGLGVYLANEQIEEPPLLKTEKYSAKAMGSATTSPVLSFKIGNVGCSSSTLSAAISAATSKWTAAPVLGGCELAGTTLKIENNGCEFSSTLTGGGPPNVAGMGLACPGKPMTLIWGACTITIGSQEWPSSVEYENNGSGKTRGVKWHLAVASVKYEQSGCPGSNGSFTDGGLSATWQLKGENYVGEQQGLWIE